MKNDQPELLPAKRKRTKYTREFKEEAVRLAKQVSARQAALDLNINATMLRDWVRTLGAEGPDAFRGQGIARLHAGDRDYAAMTPAAYATAATAPA